MDPGEDPLRSALHRLADRWPASLLAADSHTEGEATRVVLSGVPPLAGASMAHKRQSAMERLDAVRRCLTSPPRGNGDLVVVFLTEPVTPGAAFGVVFADSQRFPFACGTATIGAVTTMVALGLAAPAPDGTLTVDTPAGPIVAKVHRDAEAVRAVSLRFVPSFVHQRGAIVQLEGREVAVDTVCVGGFFAMVRAEALGLELRWDNRQELVRTGLALLEAANAQLEVAHPERPEVRSIDVVQLYDASEHDALRGRSAVIYGASHLDRSPCGTGTAAKLTLLHSQGAIGTGERFVNRGLLDTEMSAHICEQTRVGERPAVVAEVRGSAYFTGFVQVVFEPRDPLPLGRSP